MSDLGACGQSRRHTKGPSPHLHLCYVNPEFTMTSPLLVHTTGIVLDASSCSSGSSLSNSRDLAHRPPPVHLMLHQNRAPASPWGKKGLTFTLDCGVTCGFVCLGPHGPTRFPVLESAPSPHLPQGALTCSHCSQALPGVGTSSWVPQPPR